MRQAWEIIQQTDNTQPNVPFDPANQAIREALMLRRGTTKPLLTDSHHLNFSHMMTTVVPP